MFGIRNFLKLASFSLLVMLISACGGQDSVPADDPYADPGTPAPATIEHPTVAPAVSLGTPDAAGLININVAGLATAGGTGLSVHAATELSARDFTVVEDGTVKGITVRKIGEGETKAGADIAFVFDTTASMGPGLDSVRDGISSFVDHLSASGLDVRVGSVTFGDAFDTISDTSASFGVSIGDHTPPTFDSYERPSFQLSNDFEGFKDFVNYEGRSGGRAGGDFPENALGALEFAYETLEWRAGAQRILVVITDTCSHNSDTYGRASITEPWIPGTFESVLGKLKGNATVHVLSPANVLEEDRYCGPDYTDMADFTGVSGTGGVFFDWDGNEFDLTDLPLTDVVASGYVVTYRGLIDGTEKDVRLVIDNDGDIRGETTVTGKY